MFQLKHRTEIKQKNKIEIEIKIKTWIQIKNNGYGKGITNTVNIYLELTEMYRYLAVNKWCKTIYNININHIQGVPQSQEFQEKLSRSLSPTSFEISASFDKAETQSKRKCWGKSQTVVLLNSWKENLN